MIVPYTELPDEAGGWTRPLLDVVVAGMEEAPVPCLVDSGAIHTLLPSWVARAAGVSLKAAEERDLAVAASGTVGAFVTVPLAVQEVSWDAEVGFCDPWPYSWGLLGQTSFFRFFTVTFRAMDHEFEVAKIDR